MVEMSLIDQVRDFLGTIMFGGASNVEVGLILLIGTFTVIALLFRATSDGKPLLVYLLPMFLVLTIAFGYVGLLPIDIVTVLSIITVIMSVITVRGQVTG